MSEIDSLKAKMNSSGIRTLVAAAALLAATSTVAVAGRGEPEPAFDLAGAGIEPGTTISTTAARTEIGRRPVQYFSILDCDGRNSCFPEILSMSRNKRLEIRDISCIATAMDAGTVTSFNLSVYNSTGISAVRYLIPLFKTAGTNFRTYIADKLSYLIVQPRERLFLSARTSTEFSSVACSFTGDLVSLD